MGDWNHFYSLILAVGTQAIDPELINDESLKMYAMDPLNFRRAAYDDGFGIDDISVDVYELPGPDGFTDSIYVPGKSTAPFEKTTKKQLLHVSIGNKERTSPRSFLKQKYEKWNNALRKYSYYEMSSELNKLTTAQSEATPQNSRIIFNGAKGTSINEYILSKKLNIMPNQQLTLHDITTMPYGLFSMKMDHSPRFSVSKTLSIPRRGPLVKQFQTITNSPMNIFSVGTFPTPSKKTANISDIWLKRFEEIERQATADDTHPKLADSPEIFSNQRHYPNETFEGTFIGMDNVLQSGRDPVITNSELGMLGYGPKHLENDFQPEPLRFPDDWPSGIKNALITSIPVVATSSSDPNTMKNNPKISNSQTQYLENTLISLPKYSDVNPKILSKKPKHLDDYQKLSRDELKEQLYNSSSKISNNLSYKTLNVTIDQAFETEVTKSLELTEKVLEAEVNKSIETISGPANFTNYTLLNVTSSIGKIVRKPDDIDDQFNKEQVDAYNERVFGGAPVKEGQPSYEFSEGY